MSTDRISGSGDGFDGKAAAPVRVRAVHTGDELLDGRIADTNASWLGEALALTGAKLVGITVVGDDRARIRAAIEHAVADAEFVVVGGGLGPTSDDVTRDAAADAAGVALEERTDARAAIEAFFAVRGLDMPPTNLRQALIPAGAALRENARGTASAFEVIVHGVPVLCVPGVPGEYRGCVRQHLLGRLGTRQETRRIWPLMGISESEAATRLAEVEGLDGLRTSYRAAMPWLHVGISGEAETVARAQALVMAAVGAHAVGDGSEDVNAWVVRTAREAGATLATAESCTGGLVAAGITSVPGSSAVFGRGWITYANEAKEAELEVDGVLLAAHGAVSAPVALAMAAGARREAAATWAVSVTGIAGPGGGSAEKPVGTVWIAVVGPHDAFAFRLALGDRRRETLRTWSAAMALVALGRALEGRAETIRALRGVVEWLEPEGGAA